VAVGLSTSSEFQNGHPGLFSANPKMGPTTGQQASGE
jgi:hypothetical protein